MQKVLLPYIVSAVSQIERVEVMMAESKKGDKFDPDAPVPIDIRNWIAKHYKRLADSAARMGADVAADSARRAVTKLRAKSSPASFAELSALTGELKNVFSFELNRVEMYCLNRGAGAYYSPKEPLFGREVEARIPAGNDDISEAGKCFAVGRYTASVFHLMRAMESAVKALSTDLGVGNVEREWGKLLSDIHKMIEAMPKGAERNNWSQVHANLYHVKQAWRNETMHPKATYTEEEAREVFDAMKAFMRHLASMLPMTFDELLD